MENYRMMRKLGRGQYGEVWLGEHLPTSQLFALKVIPFEEENTEKALKEVQVLEKLYHPNIIRYHESFQDGQSLYIVMDYADSGDLQKRISEASSKSTPFTEKTVWNWVYQLALALDHLHKNKIIHRDLKSQNVFITSIGVLKLGDFGFAKILQNSDDLAQSSIGTPYYIAPEICMGQSYDQRADLWSLGCIIYEICKFNRPFIGDNIGAVFNGILYSQPEQLPDYYSQQLKSLVQQLLDKTPQNRPTLQSIIEQAEAQSKPEEYKERSLELNLKQKKPYQKEISINIPTPTHLPQRQTQQPNSAPCKPNVINQKPDAVSTRANAAVANYSPNRDSNIPTARSSSRHFNFSESILKQCPKSPHRPILISDFIRRRLGEEVFERLCRLLSNTKDPARLLKEEPWIISDICGVENLSIVDVGIEFDAFSNNHRIPYPPTSTHRVNVNRPFPLPNYQQNK